ncbi:ABC transporter permease [Roseimarinus sediminis]|uniref:ABC transporter permease n=1 Tax=Roseimarinus sediminis TaxID=1610899 RepID=UPI003D21B0ED
MRTLFYLLQKELIQILRDRRMLGIILVVPVLQMLILVYAANFELKDAKLIMVDHDRSESSRALYNQFSGSPFFKVQGIVSDSETATDWLAAGRADLIITVPANFERKLTREQHAQLQLIVNAINGSAAEIAVGYAQNVVLGFNKNIVAETLGVPLEANGSRIQSNAGFWYNKALDYKHYMAPGILVILVTIIGMFLSGMNLVKEKELGTTEQLNVTPIKKYQLIAGKLIPFWFIGLLDLAFGLIIARVAFDLPIEGNLLVLFLFAAVYLVGILAAGLFISTMADSQQQVLFIAYFIMMIFVLMGGIFTPVESMPRWAQIVDWFNPVCYFIDVNRMVLLKGSSLADILPHLVFALLFGVTMLVLAIAKYQKRA